MSLSIKFIGATETVTGSCYLVQAGNAKFLVDCGMYQGPDVEGRNLEPFSFNPSELDFVVLTHAHIDHSGMLPKLIKHGFKGQIYATYHSIQLATILLLDSAKIQENNYREAIPWKHAGKVQLVFDMQDSEKTISMFSAVDYDTDISPADGVNMRFKVAGHILGAASIEVDYEGKTVVFSGDIGRVKQDLIPGFSLDYKREVDYVLVESLYGGQTHPDRAESVNQLVRIIQETTARGGSVFIPCFAVQRTQEILNDLKIAKQSGALAKNLPVWLDSPMAQRVTRVYSEAMDHSEDSLFNFPELRFSHNGRQSQKISKNAGQVIIAGSGMAEGGRILSHLAGNLRNPKNSICFVGYQAIATNGRSIVEGASSIQIEETDVPIKAEIHHLTGFSAHGDSNDYIAWLERYQSPRLKKTFLIHAEPERLEVMKAVLEAKQLDHPYIPKRDEVIVLE